MITRKKQLFSGMKEMEPCRTDRSRTGRIKKFSSYITVFAVTLGCFTMIQKSETVYATDSQYQPIAVTGFTEDLIAENTDGNSASTSTSASFDDPTAWGANNVMYSVDFRGPLNPSTAAPYGLPANGVINSEQNSGVSYQLQPYNENNALLLINQNDSGTMDLQTSGAYEQIIVLASSASGASTFDVTLNFSDGTHVDTSFTTPDWYDGTGYAVKGIGRVTRTVIHTDADGTFSGTSTNPRLYDCYIDNSAQKSKLLTSILVKKTSTTGRTAIMAVAGQKSAGAPATPNVTAATDLKSTSFQANWDAVTGATSYNLDVATNPDFTSLVGSYNNLDTGNVTTYTVTGLSDQVTYYYRVRAVNSNGVSFSSATATATTASDDAAISSVLGQTITFGNQTGTSTDPKTVSMNVANSTASITASDIVKHDAGAALSFYGKDSSFTTTAGGSIDLSAGAATVVYAKVTARNGSSLYYCININREGYSTVTYDSQGGSAVSSQTNVATGSAITEPTAPTKEGYTFGGWFKEAACTNQWNFSADTVTSNTILYAKWTANVYTLTFNTNGGSAVTNITTEYGTAVTAPASPAKEGYTFGGWFTNSELTVAYDFSAQVTGNVTLHAKWIKNTTGYLPFHLSVVGGNHSETLKFGTVSGADGYYVYLSKCNHDGKRYELKKIADLAGDANTYKATGLKNNTYYKLKLKAYKIIDGKKVVFAVSNVLHSTTKSNVYANPSRVITNHSKLSINKGSVGEIQSKIEVPEGFEMDEHTALITFVSSDKSIATVDSWGKVTAVSKGSCSVYAYAQNGIYKKVIVNVK